jgi:UDP-2,3-diacylglucosamine pyrophosphatase LpxH
MLVFVSDLHLRPGATSGISRAAQFERLWQRIEGGRPGAPVRLCLLGDIFDLVRAPGWIDAPERPYHEPSPELAARVEVLVRDTLAAEAPFFAALRGEVERGALEIDYVLGNHDRLLAHAPAARAAVRAAFGMRGGDDPFPSSIVYPREGVLAYHGHTGDQLCFEPGGGAPLGDIVAAELIVRFPAEIRRRLAVDDPRLDEIDDVRPILAVPSWVHGLAEQRPRDLKPVVVHVWRELVDEFLENEHVKVWMKEHHEPYKLDFAQRVRLLLAISARAKPRDEPRLTTLYYLLMRIVDSRFALSAVKRLEEPEHRGLQYVVNGHTHFAGMRPLGLVNGKPACYFNTGTWRTLHQLGTVARGRPAFMAYDAAAYLVFYGEGDRLDRRFEFWQGAGG